MMRALLALFVISGANAAGPVTAPWIRGPAVGAAPARLTPEVHSVTLDGSVLRVTSAGISLKYFGVLQAPSIPADAPREFAFDIPVHPEPQGGKPVRVPVDVIGTFLNGLPVYNHFEALSRNGANLWHYDTVALNDDGSLTVAGRPRPELTHAAAPGVLEQLAVNGSRHSPLIGFALDGYPIYGPWAYANRDGTGGLRRMRSGYRLRAITNRHGWSGGVRLTPEQFGPSIAAEPLGTFAEDYEFVAGAGDLDESNGRFAITPEYPQGTYAYFLTTDEVGRLAYPYLIGPRFHGKTADAPQQRFFEIGRERIVLSAGQPAIVSGRETTFRISALDSSGDAVRYFEYVHERPIHVLIVPADLSQFAHIHPDLTPGDAYEVSYTFPHGGRYGIWLDYSLPGEAPRIDRFEVQVAGDTIPGQQLAPARLTQTAAGLTVELTAAQPLRAGEDIPLSVKLGGAVADLQPYLGAWTHAIIISQDSRVFSHAHPAEAAIGFSLTHTHAALGPPPGELHLLTSFPHAGLYKLWLQFQVSGSVVTVPFVLQVDAAEGNITAEPAVPADAVRIKVTRHGYEPATVEIPSHQVLTLAFTREESPNCGAEVIFPALGIRQALPLGRTVLVPLPAQPAGELHFGCGMGMFRGMLVAR